MDIETAKKWNLEYEKELKKFEKYSKNGVDLAWRCDKCSKIVYQSDILYGVGCRRCGSSRVYPITQTLTKFGLYWCLFFNWFWNRYYVKKFSE